MKVILTFYSGEVREFEIEKSQFVIGRSPKADISVSVEGLSRSHCLIEVEEGGDIYVTDLASTNGVLIDNKKIQPEKRTLYNMFLNLSIGPIQSIQFDQGDKTSHKIDNLIERKRKNAPVDRDSTGSQKTRVTSTSHKSSALKQGSHKKKEIDVITVVKFLIPVLIFLVFFYFDHMTRVDGVGEENMGEEEYYYSSQDED